MFGTEDIADPSKYQVGLTTELYSHLFLVIFMSSHSSAGA